MKIYKHRSFHQWAESEDLTDDALKEAVDEMEKGLHDGNLGSGLYKKKSCSTREREKSRLQDVDRI